MGWREVVVAEDDGGESDAVSPSSDRVEECHAMENVPGLEEQSMGGVVEPNMDQDKLKESKRNTVKQQNEGFELFVRGVAKVRFIS